MKLSKDQIAAGLNEWMRRYIEDPKAFEAEFETVAFYLKEKAEGEEEPSYGLQGAAYLEKLVEELGVPA